MSENVSKATSDPLAILLTEHRCTPDCPLRDRHIAEGLAREFDALLRGYLHLFDLATPEAQRAAENLRWERL
jgi:hypothetical protein